MLWYVTCAFFLVRRLTPNKNCNLCFFCYVTYPLKKKKCTRFTSKKHTRLTLFFCYATYIPQKSWCYGLPRYGVAPLVGVLDYHTSVWPLELG